MQTTRLLSALALILLCIEATPAAAAERSSPFTILVEAEAFAEYGGWVLDQQFMDQMGSPYLLAHGLGTPVKDATTKLRVPRQGTYHVFVRTRDWVATWNAKGSPGRFQLLVDGKPLATTFGTEGAAWHWQSGGTIDLAGAEITLALHDLTGFERPYWVPYRNLYSRNVPNLFMAGRNISVTHEALGTTRVQRTTGMMGEVVGMAVSICKKYGVEPRGVYTGHLDELKKLLQRGVGK